MPGYAHFSVARMYAVEVSGWDRMQEFFVERCDLEWGEEFEKHVALKTALRSNGVLLVRLLQPGEADRSHPVVYEAELVGKTKSGLHQFRLSVVIPHLRGERARLPSRNARYRPVEGAPDRWKTAESRTETRR